MSETKNDSRQSLENSVHAETPDSEHNNPDLADSGDVAASRSRLLMSRQTAALLVIDVQEKLIPHIHDHATIVWNIRRLVDGASLMNVSRMCTEQYPSGLGHTVSILSDRIAVDDEKSLFSCRQCENVVERLKTDGRDQVLLCGIESHVCVQQTALDLLAMGFDVWVAVDAVGSRYQLDHQTAMRRLEMAGVTLTTVESVLFEWCEDSGSHEFKRVSSLVRELPPPYRDTPDARYFPRALSRYIVQSDHHELSRTDDAVTHKLHFVVRSTQSGASVREFTGNVTRKLDDDSVIVSRDGTQSVEVTGDGTGINIQNADDSIEQFYLPIGEARSNHPRWKVRVDERHIGSKEFVHDYQILFQVVDYFTDQTFRQFVGYEHRDPDTGDLTHASGIRQIEVSADGRWIIVTEYGRPPELIELPRKSPS